MSPSRKAWPLPPPGPPHSPQPVAFAGVGVAADGVVLVGQPHDEDDVEGRGGVVEEL